MTEQQSIECLRYFNKWRRGDESLEQPNPKTIGIAIDTVINSYNKRNVSNSQIFIHRDRQVLDLNGRIIVIKGYRCN